MFLAEAPLISSAFGWFEKKRTQIAALRSVQQDCYPSVTRRQLPSLVASLRHPGHIVPPGLLLLLHQIR